MLKIELVSKIFSVPLSDTLVTENPDIDFVLDEICRNAQESGDLAFVVEGYGQRWPVDVATDFRIFLEQLPELSVFLDRRTNEFELGFYEQGIERNLLIERENESLFVECVCWGTWIPDPNIETIRTRDFEQMIDDVVVTFLSYVESRYPQLFISSIFQNWKETVRKN